MSTPTFDRRGFLAAAGAMTVSGCFDAATAESRVSRAEPVEGGWLTYRGGSTHNGRYSDGAVIEDPAVSWMADFSENQVAEPVVQNNKVFTSGWATASAHDAQTGESVWNTETETVVKWRENRMQTISDGQLVRNTFYDLFSYDADDGSLGWRTHDRAVEHDGPMGLMAPSDGAVYYGDSKGNLTAVDTADGSINWTLEKDVSAINVAPAVIGDRVYAHVSGLKNGGQDGDYAPRLIAVSTDGELQWEQPVQRSSGWQTIVATESNIAVSQEGGTLALYDASNGETVWSVTPGDSWPTAAPVIANDTVYVAANERDGGNVHAYAIEDGSERWQTDSHNSAHLGSDTSPTVGSELLYQTGADGVLRAFDTATGERRWNYAGDEFQTAPVLVDGMLYVVGQQSLYALTDSS